MWFVLAVLSAVFQSIYDILSKRSLREIDEYIMAGAVVAGAFVCLLPLVCLIGIPSIGPEFLDGSLHCGGA